MTISTAGITPIEGRIKIFVKNLISPGTVKTLQRYLGNVKTNKQEIPRFADNVTPLQLLLRKNVLYKLTQQHKDTFFGNNEGV